VAGPICAVALTAVAYGIFLTTLPPARFQVALSIGLFLSNLPALVLFLLRARWFPHERRGWLIYASAVPFVFLSNACLALAGPFQDAPGALDWAFLALSLLIACLQAGALLVMPWRKLEGESRRLDVLGSLLFGTSIFLLFWVIGLWQASFHAHLAIHLRTLAYATRLGIISGMAVYLLSQDPRRARGPLGWILGAMVILALNISFLRPMIMAGGAMTSINARFGMAILAPLCLAFAAWSRHPVEVGTGQPAMRYPLAEAVIYLPFLLAGAVLAPALLLSPTPLAWPLLTFLGITGLLVLRQFLLLREVQTAKLRLEDRVAQRTQSLERLQTVVLRTERMNAQALLGAGLAHDLNNLLGAIQGSASLLQQDLEEGTPPNRRVLQRIVDASDKAGHLTQRVMAYGREDTGHPEAPTLPIEASLLATQEILRMLLPRSIQLQVQVEALPGPVRVAPSLMEQVLVNLVGNARDAMPAGGAVTIRLHGGPLADGSGAHLDVSDTGPGIPAEFHDRIFEAFFTTKPLGKGTGLGLASVRTLMEAHGGSVAVESCPERGTTFHLTFPAQAGSLT
jgi:signal transduction histidine kinase